MSLGVDGMSAWRDPVDAHFTIVGFGQEVTLREWTWGERRRLLAERTSTGRLDPAAFITDLLDLVCRPALPQPLQPIFAHAALLLLGVRPGQASQPTLLESELLMAEAFGWTPLAIDREPAGRLDALVAELRRRRSPASSRVPANRFGTHHIVVNDD